MAVLETEMAKRNKYNLRRQAGLWIAGIVFPGFPVRWPARSGPFGFHGPATTSGRQRRRIRREIHGDGRRAVLILPGQSVRVEDYRPPSGYFADLPVCLRLIVQAGPGSRSGEPLDVRTGAPNAG